MNKAALDGFLYLGFIFTLLLAVGSNYLSILSEFLGVRVGVSDYDDCGRLYAKSTLPYSALSLVFLVSAIISASVEPTVLILQFYFAMFGIPLLFTLVLLLGQVVFAWSYHRSWDKWREEKRFHLFLGAIAAILGNAALVMFNLVNSYTLAADLPEAIRVIVQPKELSWTQQLLLMTNKTWLPLTIKLTLVGITTSALLFSAVSVLSMRRTHARADLFGTRWAFKVALLFGLPIAIVGYWVAGELHVTTPTIALGLMGQATETGVAGALLSSVNPLWHLGVVGVVAIAALAAAFYFGQAPVLSPPSWSRKIVDQELTKIAAILWVVGLASTMAVGILYQQQSVWTIYLLILGYLLIQSLWWYSAGKLRLNVAITLFAVACLSLLLMIGPYNGWYLAAKWGGVPWPPVAFAAFIPVGYLLGKRRSLGYYIIPLVSGLFLPVGIFAKLVDTTLLRGLTIIAIDPSVEPLIKYWSQTQGVKIDPLYQQYPGVTPLGIVFMIVAAYCLFIGITYLTIRLNRQVRNGQSASAKLRTS